jgi:hypothetical protein
MAMPPADESNRIDLVRAALKKRTREVQLSALTLPQLLRRLRRRLQVHGARRRHARQEGERVWELKLAGAAAAAGGSVAAAGGSVAAAASGGSVAAAGGSVAAAASGGSVAAAGGSVAAAAGGRLGGAQAQAGGRRNTQAQAGGQAVAR